MSEMYWTNVLAHVPFASYATSPLAETAVSELRTFEESGAYLGPTLSPGTLFRGTFPGELHGPYVSQLLIKDFSVGSSVNTNKVPEYECAEQHRLHATWIDTQEGRVSAAQEFRGADASPKHLYNAATLASLVHKDALYQLYFDATLISLQRGVELHMALPSGSQSSAWKELGTPDVLGHVGAVAGGALRHAWVSKFHHMKIRPEVMAMRLLQLTSTREGAVDTETREALREIMDPEFLEKLDPGSGILLAKN